MTASSEDGCMTLTEFLLARIAEDEARAKAARPDEFLPTRDETKLRIVIDLPYSMLTTTSTRVMAECEAKRLIVHDVQRNPHASWDAYAIGRDDVGRAVLRALAVPYSDHPDYRDKWRPR